jgi:CRISPR-associated protein Csx14
MIMDKHTTLIALLGGQPQVVTFTLDLLLARGEKIDQVVIVYPSSNARYHNAYLRLAQEFAGDRYLNQPCHLRNVTVNLGGMPLDDVRSPGEAEAVRRTLHDLLAQLKDADHILHLSLTGGRRVMALIALSAAMQYLTPADQVWHINTPADFIEEARDGRIMHAPREAGVQLVSVPFVPWAAYFPGLSPLLARSQQELREADFGWLGEEERQRCRRVWEDLTMRRRDVLRAFAMGLTRQQAAARLVIEPSTVDTHRDAILKVCRQVWDTYEDDFNIYFLRERFGPYLRGLGELY